MRPSSSDTAGPGGNYPAEGRSDLPLPGADRDAFSEPRPGDVPDRGTMPGPEPQRPDTPDADLPERLGERIENGPGTGIRAGEPDLVPDVEVPEETM